MIGEFFNMNDFITLLFIAIGLAMDAFSVAITDGILLKKLKVGYAFKIAMFFGVFQFGMLFLGNLLGSTFAKYISACDHWVAFFLLIFIGGKMLYDAIRGDEKEEKEEKNPIEIKTLTVLAIATSIDALAVGVPFAAMNINILYASSIVGIVAFAFSFAGDYIGNKCGNLFGNKSEIIGGIVLVGIGIKILVEHLFF